MQEAEVRRKVSRALRELDYWSITQTDASRCPKCGGLVRPPIGRPDILALHPRAIPIVVEVKCLRQTETSFPFRRIGDEQRKWLDRWEADGGRGYIALGALRPHGSRTYLDHLYLVDWPRWKEVEGLVRPIQGALPLRAVKGMRREIQRSKYDMVTLLQPWSLILDDGLWRLPPGHTAWPAERWKTNESTST